MPIRFSGHRLSCSATGSSFKLDQRQGQDWGVRASREPPNLDPTGVKARSIGFWLR